MIDQPDYMPMSPSAFKRNRERLGLTQQKMADELGVARRTLQNWEAGSNPVPRAVDLALRRWAPAPR